MPISTIATIEDLKTSFNLGIDSNPTDADMQLAVDSATEAVEMFTGRTFEKIADPAVVSARIFDAASKTVLVDWVQNVTVVEESADQVTWTAVTGTWFTPHNINPKSVLRSKSSFSEFVRVTGEFGWVEIPAAVKKATLLLAARLYKRKDNVNGVSFGDAIGVVRISRFEDPDVVRLLSPYTLADYSLA